MLEYRFPSYLPSAENLPDSDETPVDNELQELIPGLLKSILLMLWERRMDWLFAIDMGIYIEPDLPPIVPDAFLSLGVERCYDEVHKLVDGTYQLQAGNPVWMPEIGLGIGYERGNYAGVEREWLYWYDESGQRYPSPNERVRQEAQRAQQEAQRAQQLAQRLRELGVDPDSIP